MKIEHIAMYVNDLEKMREFYTIYFNAKSYKMYHNKTTGFKSYFLQFDTGARLEIMTSDEAVDNVKNLKQTGLIHLAFSVGDKECVDTLTNSLRDNGYKVISGPRMTGDGYYESCILDPENNQIEITM